eukprot:scaffold48461_cov35-Tisochrysis_lutea.AAC.1
MRGNAGEETQGQSVVQERGTFCDEKSQLKKGNRPGACVNTSHSSAYVGSGSSPISWIRYTSRMPRIGRSNMGF